jgi:hypothetical protein
MLKPLGHFVTEARQASGRVVDDPRPSATLEAQILCVPLSAILTFLGEQWGISLFDTRPERLHNPRRTS